MLSDNPIYRRNWALQYDGTPGSIAKIVNSANEWETIVARGGNWDCPSSDPTVMYLRRTDANGSYSYPCPVTSWYLFTGEDGPSDLMTDAFYQRVWRPVAEIWSEFRAADMLLADPAFVSAISTARDTAIATALAGVRQYLASASAQLPAATLLPAGTRTLAVAWPRTLPSATYDVDFLRDNTLVVGGNYTFAATAKTATGFTLSYTNSAVLTLGSGVLHCVATKLGI